MKKIFAVRYFALIAVILFAAQHALATKISQVEGLYAPDVPIFDENSQKVYLDKFEGKAILLSFWATWCAPCTQELPDLDALQKDFHKLAFEVVAVSEDFQGVDLVKQYFQKQEIRHLKIYHDYRNALFNELKVAGLPTSFLIDADGKVLLSFKGIVNWHDDEVRKTLLSHIPGNPAEPKNSYKAQSLNQQVKNPKNDNKPSEKVDSPAAHEVQKEVTPGDKVDSNTPSAEQSTK